MIETSELRVRMIRRGADQMAFRRARLAVTGLFVAALGVMPGVARASSTRTVCMSGCQFTSIQTAVDNSNPDEFIEVMPGTYTEPVVVTVRLHIFGPPGGPRPVVTSGGGGATFAISASAPGTTIQHLDIRATGPDEPAFVASGTVTATDLALAATGECAELLGSAPSQLGPGVTATTSSSSVPCILAGGSVVDTLTGVTVNAPGTTGISVPGAATLTDSTINAEDALDLAGGTVRRTRLNGAGVGLRASSLLATVVSDSVITSSQDGGDAVLASGGPGGPLVLRNVTAVADGSSSTGVGALSADGAGRTGAAVDARNVIARGTANGAVGEPGRPAGCGGPCAPGEVTLGYSNVNDAAGVIDTTTVGHNQSADPLLVNPAVGLGQDVPYRQRELAADRRWYVGREQRADRS